MLLQMDEVTLQSKCFYVETLQVFRLARCARNGTYHSHCEEPKELF